MAETRCIMRDYKSLPRAPKPGTPRLTLFGAGLGIPLLALGLVMPDGSERSLNPATTPQPLFAPQETAPAPQPAVEEPAAAVAPVVDGNRLILTVASGDSLDLLFRRHALSTTDLAAIMHLPLSREHLRIVRPGDELEIRRDGERVNSLSRAISLREAFTVTRGPEGYAAKLVELPLEHRRVAASGRIESSLFEAAATAGIPDRTIMRVAEIFGWDIDFVLDIRQGDEFTVIYEELWRDGTKLGEGEVLAAEFVNRGERFRAVRFEDAQGRLGYYTPEGKPMRKAFVRAPVAFTRISSNFNPRRRHPILNTIRAHRGVDYAAPAGTPVKAAGDGKIIFRGWKGGYGNTVILQHGSSVTTLYGHLSRFASNRKYGSRVRQGDVIGYVGASGLATAPHLHYEYRKNGVHLNPRTVTLPDADPIEASQMAAFREVALPFFRQLDERQQILTASATASTT